MEPLRGITDGRVQRSLRTRLAIVEAFRTLVAETGRFPTAEDLSERSGASIRTVFERFGDLAGVAAAVFDEILEEYGDLPWPSPALALPERIERHVFLRSEVAERWQKGWRILQDMDEERMSERVRLAVDATRRQIETLYAPELASLDEPQRQAVMVSLEAVLGLSVWIRMRDRHRLTVEQARRTWVEAARRILSPGQP
ncbi:MAG: hypothetical protein U1E23_06385 [Reyranellaceae bacterium]